jgi:hypothetical protein
VLVLLQPTSPFLLPQHVAAVLDALGGDPRALSAQTVVPCPHNHHAWNQRTVEGGYVRFRFPEERARAFNKQSKPPLFLFGNVLAVRARGVLEGGGLFAEPSLAVEIAPPFDLDVDGPGDLALADLLVRSGSIDLPHLG